MPKIVDHDQRRAELLEPCLSLFAQRGFHALSVREIARNLNVTTGTIYHYFKSKSELFEKMIEQVVRLDIADAVIEVPVDVSWSVKLRNLSQYLSAREGRFAQVVHVILDFKRNEAVDSTELTGRVLQAYRDAIKTQLNIKSVAQLDVLFSLLMGVMLYRDLDTQAQPINEQLGALFTLGSELNYLEL